MTVKAKPSVTLLDKQLQRVMIRCVCVWAGRLAGVCVCVGGQVTSEEFHSICYHKVTVFSLLRYEGSVIGSSGSLVSLPHSDERSVQMDYLTCVRWVYTVPCTTPTLLSALLR